MQFENDVDYRQPSLDHVEPVLPVRDVLQSIAYWREVLGFNNQWTSGEPPDIGAVSWGAAHVQFAQSQKTEFASHWLWIRARQLEELYKLHQKNKAEIVTTMQPTGWGYMEYIIKEINGHHLIFTAPGNVQPTNEKRKIQVSIMARTPTFDELTRLMQAVNWNLPNPSAFQQHIQSTVYAVVAENSETHEAVGCAYLMGDGKSIYYVKDVIVHPQWQRQQIGTRMMQALETWLDANAPAHATAGLFCGEQLAPFYKQFKFVQACGMYRVMEPRK